MVTFKSMFGLFRVLMFLSFSFTSFWGLWASEQRKAYDSEDMSCPKKALFIFAGYESNSREFFVFSRYEDSFKDLENYDFSVSFRYAKTYEEAKKIKSSFSEKSIDVLVYVGHGNFTCISLGESNLVSGSVEKKDFNLMKETGFIVLCACGTGDIDVTGKCIAQEISNKAGCSVFAPVTSLTKLSFSKNREGIVPMFTDRELTVPARIFKNGNVQYSNGLDAKHVRIALDDLSLFYMVSKDNSGRVINFINGRLFSSEGLVAALRKALSKDLLDISQALIEAKADFRRAFDGNVCALFERAVLARHAGMVRVLLEGKADVDQVVYDGRAAVSIASEQGDVDMVKMLVEAKANLDRNVGGWSALLNAAYEGHAGVVEVLLEGKANVDQVGSNGTALNIASEQGNVDMVKMLIDAKADLGKDVKGWFALLNAVYGGHVGVVEVLLEGKANVDQVGSNGTALSVASKRGHVDVVKVLLEGKANVDQVGSNGTALNIASEQGNVDMVKMLIDAKADLGKDVKGWFALLNAAYEGHVGVVEVLLEGKANVDQVGSNGTALNIASELGCVDMVKMLINAKADLGKDVKGWFALLNAAYEGHVGVVELLLEGKANVDQVGSNGTALSVASERGHVDVVEVLTNSRK